MLRIDFYCCDCLPGIVLAGNFYCWNIQQHWLSLGVGSMLLGLIIPLAFWVIFQLCPRCWSGLRRYCDKEMTQLILTTCVGSPIRFRLSRGFSCDENLIAEIVITEVDSRVFHLNHLRIITGIGEFLELCSGDARFEWDLKCLSPSGDDSFVVSPFQTVGDYVKFRKLKPLRRRHILTNEKLEADSRLYATHFRNCFCPGARYPHSICLKSTSDQLDYTYFDRNDILGWEIFQNHRETMNPSGWLRNNIECNE